MTRNNRLPLVPDDVRSRFAPVAANYTRSTFHASSERLQEVLDLARPKPGDLALDVATGTGNTAFALAPYVRRVIGLDLTREMLDQARRITADKAIKNVDWVLGDAAELPFQDETFDLYTVRAAPHHFPMSTPSCARRFASSSPTGTRRSSTAPRRLPRARCCTRWRCGATRPTSGR